VCAVLTPGEMIRPNLEPGIEEGYSCATLWINGLGQHTFGFIA